MQHLFRKRPGTLFWICMANALVVILIVIWVLRGDAMDMERAASVTAEPADIIASGSFTDKGGQETSGAYRIEDTEEGLRLVLSETFRTDWGPDLHVVLTPTGTVEADNDNVMVTGAHVVDELQSRSGAQTYELEADLDLSAFQSVIIHCIRFTHLYGAAPLALEES